MVQSENRIFVAFKPSGISSNGFLLNLKRKYKVKKAGFSGTLDPFAKGVLIIAFGKYTRLFSHLKKTPKTYKTTLWLGVKSETLDLEANITHIKTSIFTNEQIENVLKSFLGVFNYIPPKYSAKKVNGKRAYDLARSGKEVKLKEISSNILDIKLLNYNHPFITFKATVSEGTYIRSLGQLIANKLKTSGVLSMLERTNEGMFTFNKEQILKPIELIDAKINSYLGDFSDINLGKKIALEKLNVHKDGKYIIKSKDNFAIIAILNGKVRYLLNRVPQ